METARTAVALSSPPVTPEDALPLLRRLGYALMTAATSIPNISQGGAAYYWQNRTAVLELLLAAIKFMERCQAPPVACGSPPGAQLLAACERIKKLPLKNRAICAANITRMHLMLSDALQEMDAEIAQYHDSGRGAEGTSEDSEDEAWTAAEFAIVLPVLGLIKVD